MGWLPLDRACVAAAAPAFRLRAQTLGGSGRRSQLLPSDEARFSRVRYFALTRIVFRLRRFHGDAMNPSPIALLIEDDEDARTALASLLRRHGIDVVSVRSGREGLRELRDGVAARVILLDHMMPQDDGVAFRRAQHADTELAAIPVIVFSAPDRRSHGSDGEPASDRVRTSNGYCSRSSGMRATAGARLLDVAERPQALLVEGIQGGAAAAVSAARQSDTTAGAAATGTAPPLAAGAACGRRPAARRRASDRRDRPCRAAFAAAPIRSVPSGAAHRRGGSRPSTCRWSRGDRSGRGPRRRARACRAAERVVRALNAIRSSRSRSHGRAEIETCAWLVRSST